MRFKYLSYGIAFRALWVILRTHDTGEDGAVESDSAVELMCCVFVIFLL